MPAAHGAGMAPKAAALALSLLVAGLAGCSAPAADDGRAGDGDGDGPGSTGGTGTAGTGGTSATGTGSASAYVKDAPADEFREIHLVFTHVAVHRSGSDSGNGSSNATGTATGAATSGGNGSLDGSTQTVGDAGWIELFFDPAGVDVDLLATTGARAAFLGEADLAAGRYQQVRITVIDAYGIREDGTRENITVSSGMVRSVRSFEVEDGRETRVTIDIDLDRSLRQQGNGEWRLSPVIGKTFAAVVDDDASGEEQAEAGEVEDIPEATA